MFLKRLHMVGFKTFADSTVIDFAKGATALVGPNGCGKSNIVDAVRWVLGESSARSLRSEKMDDVIFAGSANRKPVSMAEVALTFGQGDGSDLTVKRIIYRDGQNQYYLNDAKATKTEITKMFLDSGVGKSSYSVMEQGKVDLILSSSPEDRRYIFEEAAGISLFKMQLKKTRKKLEATDNNLLRVTDILSELEREYKQKERQAERTRKYFALEEELKSHGLKIQYLRLLSVERDKAGIETTLKKLYSKKDELTKKIESVTENRASFQKEKQDILDRLHELDKDIELKKAQQAGMISQLEKGTLESQELKRKRQDLEGQLKKIQNSLKNAQGNMQKFKQLELDLTTNMDATQSAIGKAAAKKVDAEERIRKNEAQIEDNTGKIEILKEKLASVRGQIDIAVRELILEIEKIKHAIEEQDIDRDKVAEGLRKSLKTIDSFLKEAGGLGARELQSLFKEKFGEDKLDLLKRFDQYAFSEESFQKLIFDKQGIHAHKEELDLKLKNIAGEIDTLEKQNAALSRNIDGEAKLMKKADKEIGELQADMREFTTRQESISSNQKSTIIQIHNIEEQEKYFQGTLKQYNKNYDELNARIKTIKESEEKIGKELAASDGKMAKLRDQAVKIDERIAKGIDSLAKEKAQLDAIYPKISASEMKAGEINVTYENVVQDIYNAYTLSPEEVHQEFDGKKIDLEKENRQFERIRSEMNAMGTINPLALEEYEKIKALYEHNQKQKKDIEAAKKNLLELIGEIQSKASVQFIETFNQVQRNFGEIFAKLFVGGRGEIRLLDPTNPLESGIEVSVQPPGKKPKTLKMLSGGERAMTAVAIMFSTFKVKTAPYCFLDEIDAPWDESNIGRFLDMLTEFMVKSQFVIVTHAKKTMTVADQILGVTMEEPGVSKLISIEMDKNAEREGAGESEKKASKKAG